MLRGVGVSRRNSIPRFALAASLAALLLGIGGTPPPADAQTPSRHIPRDELRGPLYVEGELLVKFREDVAPEERTRAARAQGDRFTETITPSGLVKVRLGPGRKVLDAIDGWNARKDVEYAAPNATARAFFVPNDTVIAKFDIAWNLRVVHAYDAWDVVRGDPRVVLAIIDSGVAHEDRVIPENERQFVAPLSEMYRRSPELPGPFVQGYDFVNDDPYPDDDYSHGTNVATIAAGAANNVAGSAGIAFGVTIMPIKVLDYRGDSNMEWIVKGIQYAVDHGADVANLSLGFPPITLLRGLGYPGNVLAHMFKPLRDVVSYAHRKGTILVGATGNFDFPEVSPPAVYSSVIAVGATNVDNRRSSYSSYGAALDLMAPGGDFTDLNGDHIQDQIALMSMKPFRSDGSLARPDSFGTFFFIGTSAAAPHVSGAVALLLSRGMTRPNEIEQALRSTAVLPFPDSTSAEYGAGVLDLAAAVRFGAPLTTEPPPDDGGGGGETGGGVNPELISGNPSRGTAAIAFQVPQPGKVLARIFDVRGRLIRTLFEGESTSGDRTVQWDGRAKDGSVAASGIYFFRIDTPKGSAIRKVAFLR